MINRLRSVLILCLTAALLLTAIPAASAYSYNDSYPAYRVESTSPNGYCYLYDKPSSVTGRNLGRHNNGEIVKVINNDAGNGYYFVICQNGKTGYILGRALTPVEDTIKRELYRVYSIDPAGYCYLYDEPSNITGKNLGRYNNGDYFEIIDWNAADRYARVHSPITDRYGYVSKSCIVPADEYKPTELWVLIDSKSPNGYCYLYSKPSSSTGRNLGRHDNGEWVRVIDWDADSRYALVECQNGKIGYISKKALSR